MTIAREITTGPEIRGSDGLGFPFDLVPHALIVLDERLGTLQRNRAAEELFGPDADWMGRWCARVPQSGGRAWRQVFESVLAQGVAAHFDTLRFSPERGDPHTLNVDLAPVERGKRRVLLVMVDDVTREQDLTQRLAATENLAAVGRLAARVAHELNNPLDGTLRYVGLSLRLLEKDGPPGAVEAEAGVKVDEYLHHVREGLLRMTRIVADLLEFSRNAPMIHENGNINRVVEEAMNGLAHLADANRVTIMADFHDEPLMPVLEDTRLYQVCSNLIRNAIDAMPSGGQLTVHTGIVERQVVIRIQDTGAGLPDTVERVFEPFYTTKVVGKGTGLGLAICREYLAQLGGRISAENSPTGGAVFTVRIPVSACRAVAPAAGARS